MGEINIQINEFYLENDIEDNNIKTKTKIEITFYSSVFEGLANLRYFK